MFIFVATALAGTIIGWPCQRLNWGWRNVWSTCSINSYTPSTQTESPQTVPTHFRTAGATPSIPTTTLSTAGIYTPSVSVSPTMLCSFAPNTGSGVTAFLRNRCRRALDAYGALVKTCAAPAGIAFRGPVANLAAPDYVPSTGHIPHMSNIAGLTANAQMCLLPTGAYLVPQLASPSNTCPGLLGWFTVVFNACGFTNAPGLAPAQTPNTPWITNYFPIGSTASLTTVLNSATVSPVTGAGYFCTAPNAPVVPQGTPIAWNNAGATFRTGRCRKALDQFGRTAARCHNSQANLAAGPAQAGGYSDPLRFLAVGVVPSGVTATPMGMNVWTPACN